MNNVVEYPVSDLLTLAHDKSEAGRLLLAERLGDVFFSNTVALTRREELLINDLIDELLKNEHTSVRHALIQRFADTIDAPRHIASRIALGPFEIAETVLKENKNIDDNDLITVVENKGIRHAQAVASRKEISEAVADALVETGDLRVMQVVAENLGAKLSMRSLEMLMESARLSALLQKPILERKELNRDAAVKLYWWTSHDLRRTTLDRFGFGPGRLEEELNNAIEKMLSVHMLQKDDDEAMDHLANWLAERDAMNVQNLSQFLRAGHYKLFNIALSRIARLELSVVNAITSNKEGRTMAALCRAIKIEKGKFISIYLMARGARSDEEVIHPRELASVLKIFEHLTPEMTQSMLQTWRSNPSAILEVEETKSQQVMGN